MELVWEFYLLVDFKHFISREKHVRLIKSAKLCLTKASCLEGRKILQNDLNVEYLNAQILISQRGKYPAYKSSSHTNLSFIENGLRASVLRVTSVLPYVLRSSTLIQHGGRQCNCFQDHWQVNQSVRWSREGGQSKATERWGLKKEEENVFSENVSLPGFNQLEKLRHRGAAWWCGRQSCCLRHGIPCSCRFVSLLFQFQSSTLLIVWENQ